ncbi:hypothetical protein FRD01_12905 [Microvenator marinus]|uniref:histidine kinase n=1 Tax=Microvenator marinus TaxID=2600177 RepID=A0A5B8XVK5_9DELT|nr:ATP-binding protein [Microvenator marinus]QED28113.1 hypothetical protein FRD01_12905 [Microvenator marinus]
MYERLKIFESPRTLIALSLALIFVITVSHFATDTIEIAFHNVYRRLYYLPILIGSFAYGLRGGSLIALLVSLAYIPHAFFSAHHDPAPTIDKVLEILLYVVVGALTGWLVDRERAVKHKLEDSLIERQSMEAQLIRAGKLSALGEMLAGVAHEIRNPLASIKGSAEALATEFKEEHPKYRMSQVLLIEIERLTRLVAKFLLFARNTETQRTEINLNEIVEQTVEFGEMIDNSIFTVRTSETPVLVRADHDQIKQVLLNLVLNAIRATKDVKFPMVEIMCGKKTFHSETRAFISVRDNGGGIRPDFADRIFDPFVTTEETGTGLGLSISHMIMDNHGGYMEVESTDVDTVFWVIFEAPNEA